MNTNVSTTCRMDDSKLIFNNYFQTYVQEAYRQGLISEIEVTTIQMMLLKLLEAEIQRYTRFESSSVKTETAENIMRSILYNLDFKFKSLKGEEGVSLLKTESVETLFRAGILLVKEQVEKSKIYLERIQKNCLKVENLAYNHTINHGFTDFYPYYDPEFGAHLGAADIDYPLCFDQMKKEGIEYVYGYLKKLYYENEFCRYFKIEEINQLLESSHPHHEELLINIFELVLVNSLGCTLVHKDVTTLVLSKSDCMVLQGEFENVREPLELLRVGAMQIIEHFRIKGFLKQYIFFVLPGIATRITEAVANKRVDQVFVVFKASKDCSRIDFEDGVSLADEDFRVVIEEINECRDINKKLVIFKEHIHSLKDMIDCLEAECLYGNEYQFLYATLSGAEIALLLKVLNIDDETGFNLHLQEVINNKVLVHYWERELLLFLDTKAEEDRYKLWQVVKKIDGI